MDINYFMDLAIKQAKKGILKDEVPVGALIVDNKSMEVISLSHNKVVELKSPLKHAELILIEDVCKKKDSKYLFNTSIFVTLEPCTMCAAAISEAKINRIYFGAYDSKKGSLESIMNIYKLNNLFVPEVYGGIKEKECSKLISNFFTEKRIKNL